MSDLEDPTAGAEHSDLSSAAGQSLAERIKRRHARRVTTIDLAIPEWEGEVVVRYGRLSKKAIIASQSGRKSPARQAAHLLDAACQEVLLRDEEDGSLHPAGEGDGNSTPVRFDGRLADLFDLEAPLDAALDSRDIVTRMYADDIAMITHAQRIMDWQTGASLDDLPAAEVDDLAGEPGAAT